MSKTDVKIKKINAFPFPLVITVGATVIKGQVVKMSELGIMAEVESGLFTAGEKVDIQFELPVIHFKVASQGVVIKFMNAYNGVRLAEIHFKNLNEGHRAQILNYLTAAKVKA